MKALTDIFIRKPVLAVVVNLVILAIGFRAISLLPVRQYPRIESSSVVITTAYIGASAETVRGFISTPIERAVAAIDGIDYIESTSIAGLSTITVRLRLNHPSNAALAEISARLNQVRSELPQEAESPVVNIQRTDRPYATFYVSFTSDRMDLMQLTDMLSRQVQPAFSTIEGVQRVDIEGPRNLAMRIWLDRERLTALDVTPLEVQRALSRNNFLASVGTSKNADVQVDLLTDTDLRSVEDFQRLIIREENGVIVRLRDVARVELGSEEAISETGLNGRPAIYLSVWPLPSANELEVAERLRATMERVRPALPTGVDMILAFDGTFYMNNAIKEISKTLAETVAIVGLIVFLFMGSLRTVLVPLIAIPVSLVGACLVMLVLGFSLNLLTILAIVLAVGLVVDDAIVMVENVERHLRDGMGRLQAALTGARELLSPVISMTITLAAVYAPIGFQAGLTGVLFKEFAFTLAAAVIVSGVVALTLSPVMSAYLASEKGRESGFARWVNGRFDRLRALYGRVLDTTLQMRWSMALATVLVAIAAIPMYRLSSKELAPTEDEGFVFFILQNPPDASLDAMRRAATEVSQRMLALPDTVQTFSILQPSFGFGGALLKNWSSREASSFQVQQQAFGAVSSVAAVRAIPVLPPPLPGAGQFGVEMMVTANDVPERMEAVAQQIVGRAFASGKFMFADTDLKIDLPQTRIVIDREKVADLGLDLATVGSELAVMLSGGYVNRFNLDGRSYKVIPQIAPSERVTPEQILQLKMRSSSGGLVSVSSFVRLETVTAPRSLNRFQQRDSMKIYGEAAPGVTKEEALFALEQIAREVLPVGYAIDYAGESRQIRTEGASLTVTLGFALGLIYLVLAAQFSSFRDPLIVLLGSVPLAITGALVFTYVDLTTVNIYSQVGLITLVGLVAKNGILIVEFANHLREQGVDKLSAAKEAAQTRLRPILMTSAATVFGHFPLVLVTGPGAEARNSIGIVLVAGMTISTVFTLLVVPSIYVLLAGRRAVHIPPEADGGGHSGRIPGRSAEVVSAVGPIPGAGKAEPQPA
ncbi:MAG: efflux RND transporter permease subunit [Planctomycetaceae bacterium]|jgi:multidrug efflux pump|nr:efflux RND transporter permease subunit [Phycisphaerales bacterium]MCE2652099.1 efflux RND transporter permease subunit [Planctomycetaceae bacterium]